MSWNLFTGMRSFGFEFVSPSTHARNEMIRQNEQQKDCGKKLEYLCICVYVCAFWWSLIGGWCELNECVEYCGCLQNSATFALSACATFKQSSSIMACEVRRERERLFSWVRQKEKIVLVEGWMVRGEVEHPMRINLWLCQRAREEDESGKYVRKLKSSFWLNGRMSKSDEQMNKIEKGKKKQLNTERQKKHSTLWLKGLAWRS